MIPATGDGALAASGGSGRLERSPRLVTRLASALVLGAVALAANFAGAPAFAVLVALLALVMSWEWSRVVRGVTADVAFAASAVAVAAGVALAALGMVALAPVALGIGAILVAFSSLGPRPRLSAAGVLYVGLPAVALVWLRGSDPAGATAILLLFLLVWTFDTAAFAIGSLIGGPKLMPRVSPKKTWAGLAGGVLANVVLGASFATFVLGAAPWWLAACGAAAGLVAQAGDLLESAVKRGSGVKDVSGFIPGHGGFMDRLDSTGAVAVAAGLAALAIDPRGPARALLFGW